MGSTVLVSTCYFLGQRLSIKIRADREKISPFECGFTPKINARMPFSIRFFLLALVFLIFDVELVLISPYLLVMVSGALILRSGVLISFIVILLLGVFHE